MPDPARRMTAEEYFALPETNHIEELIDGMLITDDSTPVVIPQSTRALHQIASGNAYDFLRHSGVSGRAYYAPAAIHFDEQTIIEPDVFWIREGGECQLLDKGYWIGAPDVVVEVLEKTTEYRDRGVRFEAYQKHGVREYWLIDVISQFVEVFIHQNRDFRHLGAYGTEESFTSPVLGVEVKVEAIFAL